MSLFKNLRNSALLMSTASVAMIPTALAATTVDADSIISKVIDIITDMALWIGIILLVWSIVMLILALKNEDADSKSRAIMLIAVSVALIGLGGLLDPILKEFGLGSAAPSAPPAGAPAETI